MKILYTADWHLKKHRPINRIDEDYQKTQLQKVEEVNYIAEKKEVDGIWHGGDLFGHPYPDLGLLNAIVGLFRQNRKNKIPFYCVPGNHDVEGYELGTLHKTGIGNLQKSGLLRVLFEKSFGNVSVTGFPYNKYHSLENYKIVKTQVVITHNMIVPNKVPFEHLKVKDVAKVFKGLVLCSHYHLPFEAEVEGTMFINPGSLLRLEGTKQDIERTPQVVLLCFGKKFSFEYIKLTSAKTGLEVFDVFGISIEKQREVEVNQFAKLLETRPKEYDLEESIKQIGKEKGMEEVVIDEALRRISVVNGLSKET